MVRAADKIEEAEQGGSSNPYPQGCWEFYGFDFGSWFAWS
jgi:hypothetical protein